jgi:hypothetical protein
MFTTTVAINPAFLQEIKDDHQELWQLLAAAKAVCAVRARRGSPEPTAEETVPALHPPVSRRLVELLSRLRDQLGMHFALEEAFGYFDDPVSVAPRLCQRAEQLRGQHDELFMHMCRLVDEAEQLFYHESPAVPLTDLAAGFHDFHRALMEHEAQENTLILQAFDDDLGVGD